MDSVKIILSPTEEWGGQHKDIANNKDYVLMQWRIVEYYLNGKSGTKHIILVINLYMCLIYLEISGGSDVNT